MTGARIDKPLAMIIAILITAGCFVFVSAIFGLVARSSSSMSSVAFNHLVLGVGVGILGLIVASRVNHALWRRFAPHIFIITLLLTAAVFIPQIGFEHGGGRRWIDLGFLTLQPSEGLKIASIIMAAAYFSSIRSKIEDFKWGLGGLGMILAGPVVILLAQPDMGTLGVIVISVLAIYFAAGARLRDFAFIALGVIVALVVLATLPPYILDRIQVFLHPSRAPQAEGYQIKQSLIAIGSGGVLGRGFGQSVQKFTYLPEPMGDPIFAAAAEEFGFLGAIALIGLFLAFALRGLSIASRVTNPFGALLAVGISFYLASEAFINIAAMLGVAPLTGIPLPFISQGGSAMLVSLASAGILLSISRRRN